MNPTKPNCGVCGDHMRDLALVVVEVPPTALFQIENYVVWPSTLNKLAPDATLLCILVCYTGSTLSKRRPVQYPTGAIRY